MNVSVVRDSTVHATQLLILHWFKKKKSYDADFSKVLKRSCVSHKNKKK